METNSDTLAFGISLKRYLHREQNAVKFSHAGDAMGSGVSVPKKHVASEVAKKQSWIWAKSFVWSCLHMVVV